MGFLYLFKWVLAYFQGKIGDVVSGFIPICVVWREEGETNFWVQKYLLKALKSCFFFFPGFNSVS